MSVGAVVKSKVRASPTANGDAAPASNPDPSAAGGGVGGAAAGGCGSALNPKLGTSGAAVATGVSSNVNPKSAGGAVAGGSSTTNEDEGAFAAGAPNPNAAGSPKLNPDGADGVEATSISCSHSRIAGSVGSSARTFSSVARAASKLFMSICERHF